MSAPLLALTSSSTGNPCTAFTVTDSGCGPLSAASTLSAAAFAAAWACSVSSRSCGEVTAPPK